MAEALLEVDDLHTHFHLKKKTVRAVNGVSFAVRRGDTFPGLDERWLRLAVRDRGTVDAFLEALGKALAAG